eukprot:s512_g25.t1
MASHSSPDLTISVVGPCEATLAKRRRIVSGLHDAFQAFGLDGSKYAPQALFASKREFEKECHISRSILRRAKELCLHIMKDLSDRSDQCGFSSSCACSTCTEVRSGLEAVNDSAWRRRVSQGAGPHSKARSTGAVQNRRKEGDPGTWTCPDCFRTIADNACSKKQHFNSQYCRASRLWNQGYAHRDWAACKHKAGKDEAATRKGHRNYRLRSRGRSREIDHHPRRVREASRHSRRPTRRTEQRERSRSRARSSGHSDRKHGAGSRYRGDLGRNQEQDRREVSQRPCRGDLRPQSPPRQPEFVKVVVEKYEPRAATPASRQEQKVERSEASKPQKTMQTKEKEKEAPAEAATHGDSDYTYEYDSSTPEGVDAQKKPATVTAAAAKTAGSQGSSGALPGRKSSPAPKPVVVAEVVAAASADSATEYKDLMNTMLKTALETAGRRYQ